MIRFASFNVAMSADSETAILEQTATLDSLRFKKIAATIQSVRPDVLLLCEFDHLGEGGDNGALRNFCRHYLNRSQYDLSPIHYPYSYCPSSNTGKLSPVDLNNDGIISLPEDGLGFGLFHGHYSFVLLSKYPIKTDEIQSWQTLLWQQMPNSLLPTQYYSPQAQSVLPLSSKNHVCVPIEYDEQIINILCCHPTPPVFDGEERRNAKRNHDELRLLVDIIDGADYLVSDQGQTSGINLQQPFVVMGDLNADPIDGDGIKAGIDALLNHPLIEKSVATGAKVPASLGGKYKRVYQKRNGKPDIWTHVSGLRLDYVLPSTHCHIQNSGVFWPDKKDPKRAWITNHNGKETSAAYSDHRLVWVDVTISK